jgi:hypothetical protein
MELVLEVALDEPVAVAVHYHLNVKRQLRKCTEIHRR